MAISSCGFDNEFSPYTLSKAITIALEQEQNPNLSKYYSLLVTCWDNRGAWPFEKHGNSVPYLSWCSQCSSMPFPSPGHQGSIGPVAAGVDNSI